VVPLFTTAGHGHVPPLDQVRDLVAYVDEHRRDRPDSPFEIVLGGVSPADPALARDLIAPHQQGHVAYEASDTVLMLKSGMRSGGMTVRGK
jgi:hypothetical protein